MLLRNLFPIKGKGKAESTDPAEAPYSPSRLGIKYYNLRTLWRTKSNDGASASAHPLSSQPVKLSSYTVDPTAAYETKPNQKSTVKASVGLALDVLKESSDAFTPLKSVAGGLAAVLKHYDQTIANRETIQLLIPRVEGLVESLSEPAPEGEVKEIERRQKLKQ